MKPKAKRKILYQIKRKDFRLFRDFSFVFFQKKTFRREPANCVVVVVQPFLIEIVRLTSGYYF